MLVVQQIEEENQELLQELNAMTMTTELIDRGSGETWFGSDIIKGTPR